MPTQRARCAFPPVRRWQLAGFRIKPDIGTMLSHMMQEFQAGCIEFGNRDTRSWASASSITAAAIRTTASAKNSWACICTAVEAPYEICCAASTASYRALMMRAGTFTRSGRVPVALTTKTTTGKSPARRSSGYASTPLQARNRGLWSSVTPARIRHSLLPSGCSIFIRKTGCPCHTDSVPAIAPSTRQCATSAGSNALTT